MSTMRQLAVACTNYDGDEREYANLVVHLRPLLNRYYRASIAKFYGTQYQQEVITQTLTVLHRALVPFQSRQGARLGKFLNLCMMNKLREVLAKERKHDRYTIRKQNISMVHAGVTANLEDDLINKEERAHQVQWLRSKMPQLRPKEREVLTYMLMDHTPLEISNLLSISVASVNQHAYHLRKHLIQRLKDDTEAAIP